MGMAAIQISRHSQRTLPFPSLPSFIHTSLHRYGSQYTHGGYVGMGAPGGPVLSGLQRLVLRRNGFVSLSTTSTDQPGVVQTDPFALPPCTAGAALFLQLNIATTIGRGALAELLAPDGSTAARSERIDGNYVRLNVSWASGGAARGGATQDVRALGLADGPVALRLTMWSADLYSTQFVCA